MPPLCFNTRLLLLLIILDFTPMRFPTSTVKFLSYLPPALTSLPLALTTITSQALFTITQIAMSSPTSHFLNLKLSLSLKTPKLLS